MRLGMHMRELWGHRLGLAIALAIALLAAARTQGFTFFPPGLDRADGDARAVAHIFVDTPRPIAVDLRQSTYDIDGLIDQTLLVSNATASVAVRERIAARAGLPVGAISIETPLSVKHPVGIAEPGASRAPLYRVGIQANPTVPLIDVNAQAPTEPAAVRLADDAADALGSYLASLARGHATPLGSRLELVRLGRAQPLAGDGGHGPISTLLVFVLVFAAASATVLFVTRVRRGWRAAADAHDADRAPPLRP